MTAHGSEIAAIECFHVEWPGPRQFPARSSWVRVRDKAGRTGLGEASPMLDSALSLSFLSGYVAPDLIGADPFDTAVIFQRALNKAMKLGPHGIVTAGLAALDIALWDLKGKIVGRPIYALLGGAWRFFEREPEAYGWPTAAIAVWPLIIRVEALRFAPTSAALAIIALAAIAALAALL